MNRTNIEYVDATWSPVTGCTPISTGCKHCWAERTAHRLVGRFGYPADDPFKLTLHADRLEEIQETKTPMWILVCSMGDLFHEHVPVVWIRQVFASMRHAPWHTYLLLTKRPWRMAAMVDDYFTWNKLKTPENWWFGISAEDQQNFDYRWPIASEIPGNLWVSGEPLLSSIDLSKHDRKPDWFIAGCETGPGARAMCLDWPRDIRYQCQENHVPFFMKRVSSKNNDVPPDLMVREIPA